MKSGTRKVGFLEEKKIITAFEHPGPAAQSHY